MNFIELANFLLSPELFDIRITLLDGCAIVDIHDNYNDQHGVEIFRDIE